MYNVQANSTRFVYTLNYLPKGNNKDHARSQKIIPRPESGHTDDLLIDESNATIDECRLKNGLYFSKESRTDGKIRFNEQDMEAVVRTVMFIHAFRLTPNQSIADIVQFGSIDYTVGNFLNVQFYPFESLCNVIYLLDSLFGGHFSAVVRRVIMKCYNEYRLIWLNFQFTELAVNMPSADDYVKLLRFVNCATYKYSATTQFLTKNVLDHKIPLQNSIKNLKN